jgi:hypothetical protein
VRFSKRVGAFLDEERELYRDQEREPYWNEEREPYRDEEKGPYRDEKREPYLDKREEGDCRLRQNAARGESVGTQPLGTHNFSHSILTGEEEEPRAE